VKAEEDEEFIPDMFIEGSQENVTVMRVKSGSKTKNLIQFAEKKLANDSETQIFWEGSGDAVQKTITCAEILKKKFNHSLHQITRLSSMTIVETWKPRLDGLDAMRVKRHLPLVKILLSKEPLSPDANGYQAPDDVAGLFDRGSSGSRPKSNKTQQQNRNKRRNHSTTESVAAPDETLLADSNRRKDFEKKNKMEKKQKKAASVGKDSSNSKSKQQAAKLEASAAEGENLTAAASSGNVSSPTDATKLQQKAAKSEASSAEVVCSSVAASSGNVASGVSSPVAESQTVTDSESHMSSMDSNAHPLDQHLSS